MSTESNVNLAQPLQIDSVAFGGNGVGRTDGKVFFVPDTLPGDVVQVRVVDDKGRYCHAEVTERLVSSAHRGQSPCVYSERCGGCQWQGVPYEEQLKWKLNFVTSSLSRIGRLTTDDVSIIGSTSHLGYRNRIHLKAEWSEKLAVGYYAERSHQLVEVVECMIADSSINSAINILTRSTPKSPKPVPFRFEIQRIINHADPQRNLLVTVFPNQRDDTDTLRTLVANWKDSDRVAWVGFMFENSSAPFFVVEEDGGITYHTKPGIFQQVNVMANRTLRHLLQEKVLATSPDRILDLYCGSGNFSLGLARHGIPVQGSEFSRLAIDCARHNVAANAIQNSSYLSGDSVAHAWKVAKKGERFSHIIADPPRDGMYDAVNPLLNIDANHIFYVSCDPSTLARDLGKLCRSRYRIKSLKAFDFFPNTYHVETLVHLERQ